MSEPAVDWETVSRTELNQLRRENAALRAHVGRLENELADAPVKLTLTERFLSAGFCIVPCAVGGYIGIGLGRIFFDHIL